jgi:integrase
MIFRKARLDGFLFEDPAEGVSVIKRRNEENSRRPLTIPEIQAVLRVADPEWQSIIKFGLYTGQRLADLAVLTWNHVDLERGEIRMITRKTGKRLLLPIAGACATILNRFGARSSRAHQYIREPLTKLAAHDGTLMCIGAHVWRKIAREG